jgi:hypothetical protein
LQSTTRDTAILKFKSHNEKEQPFTIYR